MTLNPFYLEVTFPSGLPEVRREYKGAIMATDNMGKAMQYYEAKNIPCTITLYDYRHYFVAAHTVEEKKEAPL